MEIIIDIMTTNPIMCVPNTPLAGFYLIIRLVHQGLARAQNAHFPCLRHIIIYFLKYIPIKFNKFRRQL